MREEATPKGEAGGEWVLEGRGQRTGLLKTEQGTKFNVNFR